MLKKRLIGTITVKNGQAVQSMGYKRYLPLGSVECIAENLDRWGADEILVLSIDRTSRQLGPDLNVIEKIAKSGLSTPLAYGGGISSEADAAAVIKAGAERVCIDALLRSNPKEVEKIALRLGAQAVIAAFPLAQQNTELLWHDYLANSACPISNAVVNLINEGIISEALVVDYEHEGYPQSFNPDLLSFFEHLDIPLIPFGGISEPNQLALLFNNPKVVAVGIGNFLSYREHAIQQLKQNLASSPIRSAYYQQQSV